MADQLRIMKYHVSPGCMLTCWAPETDTKIVGDVVLVSLELLVMSQRVFDAHTV